MTDVLLHERRDAVALLTLNRPEKRNALSRELRDAIVAALDACGRDAAVRAVVLAGAGPVFCAGFDRGEFASGDPASIFAQAAGYHRRVFTFSKPLVAAVQGDAVAGGCDLAAMCDLRVAAASARFGQPQVRLGIPAAYDLMRETVGAPAAREMCLTGRLYGAEEARAIGLVHRVVDPAQALTAALALADEIAKLPGESAASLKHSFVSAQPELF